VSNTIKSVNSIVTQIVNRLDRNDNPDKKTDGVIKKDEWNKFAAGKGKQVTVGIHTSKAEKSVKYYLGQQRKTKNGQRDLAQSWLDKLMNEDVETMAKKLEEDKLAAKNSKSKVQYIKTKSAKTSKESDLVSSLKKQDDELKKRFSVKNYTNNIEEQKKNIKEMMHQEILRRGLPEDAAKKIDYEYWTEKIYNVANKYEVQPALLIAIMSQETNGTFNKGVDSVNGHGIMGITLITTTDILENRQKAYLELDNKLASDIFYQKDKDGNIMKDKDGNPIQKYKNPNDLLNACVKNEELCLKVGLLVYEMKFMHEIVKQKAKISKTDRSNVAFDKQIKMTKEQLASGEIMLSQSEVKALMDTAAEKYNNCTKLYTSTENKGRMYKDVYHEQVTDSLRHNHYDYSKDLIKL